MYRRDPIISCGYTHRAKDHALPPRLEVYLLLEHSTFHITEQLTTNTSYLVDP